MYSVSSEFLSDIKQPSRVVASKVVIRDTTLYSTDIISFFVEDSFGSDNIPVIGGIPSKKLHLEILVNENTPSTLIGVPIVPYVAIKKTSSVEYSPLNIYSELDYEILVHPFMSEHDYMAFSNIGIPIPYMFFEEFDFVPLGVFYADYDDYKRNDTKITIECFDKMASFDNIVYESTLSYPTTVQSMLNEISGLTGVPALSHPLSTTTFKVKPNNLTVRQVLSQIASLTSTNCFIDRDGNITFKFTTVTDFSIDANNYVKFELLSESKSRISQLRIPSGSEDEPDIVVGDSTGVALELENVSVTSTSELQTILNRVYPLEFYAYSMTAQGMPHLDFGDIISLTDRKGVVRNIIIGSSKFTYNGGFKSEFKMDAPKMEKVSVVTTGVGTILSSPNFSKSLNDAVSSATALITGNDGGYVALINDEASGKPKEIVIMDTESTDTATRVWRWNSSGLGYSSNGYNGSYGLAMTINGQIVADYIATGTLDASKLIVKNLVVGENVTMGANAYISWDKVTDQPSAEDIGAKPYDWNPSVSDVTGLAPKLTYIDSGGIYTGILTAQQINAIQGITLGANASISWSALPSTVASVYAIPTSASDIGAVEDSQTAVFNTLTNYGANSGLYMSQGKLYINASYIQTGTLNTSRLSGTVINFDGGPSIDISGSNLRLRYSASSYVSVNADSHIFYFPENTENNRPNIRSGGFYIGNTPVATSGGITAVFG